MVKRRYSTLCTPCHNPLKTVFKGFLISPSRSPVPEGRLKKMQHPARIRASKYTFPASNKNRPTHIKPLSRVRFRINVEDGSNHTYIPKPSFLVGL